MSDFHPFRMVPPTPPPVPIPPPPDLLTVVHDGICAHCTQWTYADEVFLDLPRLGRCVCLRCYYALTGTRPQVSATVWQEAIAAAGKE